MVIMVVVIGGSCDHGVLRVLVLYLCIDRHRETRSVE